MRRLRFPLLLLLIAALAVPLAPSPAAALPLVAGPRVLMLGDSITWQGCTGAAQRVGSDAPDWLEQRDGGCYGFAGASAADMAFMVQGGRFFSSDPGQPHPWFPDRGMADPYGVREAIDRADVVVFGLGTNDANRLTSCGDRATTWWPVQIANRAGSGPNPPPCQLSIDQFRAHLDYFTWLAGPGTPVFWFDVAVTDPTDPAYAHQDAINAQIWAAAGRWPNFHPIPWQRAVAAHPEYLRDGVHVSDAGRAARHQLLYDAIRGCGIR